MAYSGYGHSAAVLELLRNTKCADCGVTVDVPGFSRCTRCMGVTPVKLDTPTKA